MVARKRFPMTEGAEIAHLVSGFSRLSPETFSRNKHAGLYSVKVFKSRFPVVDNGPFNKVKRHEARKKKSCKKRDSILVFGADGLASEVPREIFMKSVKIDCSGNRGQKVYPVRKNKAECFNFKVRKNERNCDRNFSESEEMILSKKLKKVLFQTSSLEKRFEDQHFSPKEYLLKLKMLNEMMWTNKELAKKISKVRSILICNQAFKDKERIRHEFSRKVWAEKLKKSQRNKAHAHSRKNSALNRINHCELHAKRTAGHVNLWNCAQKTAPRRMKCRHVVHKHPDGCRYYSTNFYDDKIHDSFPGPVTFTNAPTKSYLSRNFEFAAMTVDQVESNENRIEMEPVQGRDQLKEKIATPDPKPTFSFSSRKVSRVASVAASNARSWFNINKPAEITELSAQSNELEIAFEDEKGTAEEPQLKRGSSENMEAIICQLVKEQESLIPHKASTPLMSNSKIITHISTEDDGATTVSAVSSIPNSSSVHKAKINTPPNISNGVPESYRVSSDPSDVPLRAEGILPSISCFEDLTGYFEPFMIKLIDLAETADSDEFENDLLLELATFIKSVSQRFQSTFTDDQYSHHLYLEVIDSHVADIFNISQENHARAVVLRSTSSSNWFDRKNHLNTAVGLKTVLTSNKSHHVTTGSPDDDGGDDDDDDDSSSDHDDKRKPDKIPSIKIPSSGKKCRSAEKKKQRSAGNGGNGGGDSDGGDADDSSSDGDTFEPEEDDDDSTPNDALYH